MSAAVGAFLIGEVCGFEVALILGCDLLRKCTCDANWAICTTCERAQDESATSFAQLSSAVLHRSVPSLWPNKEGRQRQCNRCVRWNCVLSCVRLLGGACNRRSGLGERSGEEGAMHIVRRNDEVVRPK
jgi:hypothetical protein